MFQDDDQELAEDFVEKPVADIFFDEHDEGFYGPLEVSEDG